MQSPATNQFLSAHDLSLLQRCNEASGYNACSIGLPTDSFANCGLANKYMFWSPTGIPVGSSVAVASSRLNRKLDEQADWFAAIRTLAVQVSRQQKFLITAEGTTTDPYLRRLAELFEIPLLIFEAFPSKPAMKWYFETSQKSTDPFKTWTCFYKRLDSTELPKKNVNIDELLIGSANQSYLISVSKNGNIRAAAKQRLANDAKRDTRVLIDPKLTPSSVDQELRQLGATAWWLYGNESPDRLPDQLFPKPGKPLLSLKEIKTDSFLIHWTRRRVGPWPDQTQSEFLDDLIFQSSRRNHGEVSALCRILASDRILGTRDLTRDNRDVVCFSNLPLNQQLQRRVFRRHLGRWDFEPFGIAIDRDLLERSGARPVVYGTESDWNSISDSDRPFFQLKQTADGTIDWTSENEWRITGDLRLTEIPNDQAVVFVKTKADAEWIGELSRWPVVVLSLE